MKSICHLINISRFFLLYLFFSGALIPSSFSQKPIIQNYIQKDPESRALITGSSISTRYFLRLYNSLNQPIGGEVRIKGYEGTVECLNLKFEANSTLSNTGNNRPKASLSTRILETDANPKIYSVLVQGKLLPSLIMYIAKTNSSGDWVTYETLTFKNISLLSLNHSNTMISGKNTKTLDLNFVYENLENQYNTMGSLRTGNGPKKVLDLNH